MENHNDGAEGEEERKREPKTADRASSYHTRYVREQGTWDGEKREAFFFFWSVWNNYCLIVAHSDGKKSPSSSPLLSLSLSLSPFLPELQSCHLSAASILVWIK